MKKIGIIIVVVLALLGGAYGYLSFAVDEEAFAQSLQTQLASALKREVKIGEVEGVSLFPAPHLVVHSVEVANAPAASKPQWVVVPEVRIAFPWGNFLKGDVSAYRMTLVSPAIQLEVLPQGQGNWAQSLEGLGEVFASAPVEVQNASFHYTDVASGVALKADGISAVITPDNGKYHAEGQWKHEDIVYALKASWQGASRGASGLAAPFEVSLASETGKMDWQGEVLRLETHPRLNGKLSLEGNTQSPFLKSIIRWEAQDTAPVKLRFSADTQLDSRVMVVRNGELAVENAAKGTVLKGVVQWNYVFGGQPQLHWSGALDRLDADFFSKASLNLHQKTGKTEAQANMGITAQFASFLQTHAGTVQGYAKEVTFNGQTLPYIQWQADFTGGQMQVKRLTMAFPGKAQAQLDGLVRTHGENLTFTGKWSGEGEELADTLQVFWPKPQGKEQPQLGRFIVKSNIAWDEEQLRLSEFQARVGDALMGGALVFKEEGRLKVESFLKLVRFDVDKALAFASAYVETMDNEMVVENPGDLFEQRYTNRQFDWVNALGFDAVASLSLKDYTFLGEKGEQADFTLNITSNSAGFDQLRAEYAGYQIGGDISLTLQKDTNPLIKAKLAVNQFDAKTIFPEMAEDHDDREWQAFLDKPLDLKLLQLYEADVDVHFGQLKMRELVFDDLRLKANVQNGRLTFEEFAGKMWDGAVNVRLVMQAGSIPSLAMSFTMENMSLVKMAGSSRLLSSMAGLVRASGEITTSGAVMRTWLTNARGEVRIDANDISIRGIGISTLSRAVPVARQVQDIVQAGKHALSSGLTRITDLNGFITIEKGKASTPRMVYNSAESTGTIEGEVDLVKEKVDILMHFYLHNTVQEGRKPPVLKLELQGEIGQITKQLDTQELENYVSQAAAARALRN